MVDKLLLDSIEYTDGFSILTAVIPTCVTIKLGVIINVFFVFDLNQYQMFI